MAKFLKKFFFYTSSPCLSIANIAKNPLTLVRTEVFACNRSPWERLDSIIKPSYFVFPYGSKFSRPLKRFTPEMHVSYSIAQRSFSSSLAPSQLVSTDTSKEERKNSLDTTSTVSASTSSEEQQEAVMNQEQENTGEKRKSRRFSKGRIFMSAILTIFAGYFAYYLYLFDFNLSKLEWKILSTIKRLFWGTGKEDTTNRSKFLLSLSDETQKQIALHFLQFDLDKENGVRRSDALDLVEQLGFSVETSVCKDFVMNGRGRGYDAKKFSGCSIQEFGELIEALILEEESQKMEELPVVSTWIVFGFDLKNFKRISTQKIERLNAARPLVQTSLTEAEKRVKNTLQTINQSSLPNPMKFDFLQRESNISRLLPLLKEEVTVEEVEYKSMELERLEKAEQRLSELKKRRKFSDAEDYRLEDIRQTIKALRCELFDSEAVSTEN
ncbi:hypothetical protein IE077_002681 [Cardiosporidium cionae]|uniref:EF-hand domain-containing protein n=1 Tax=Cardiosporidium cionae TaxID=476202 RepID=A0ABQ7JA78_9APIC|nr:hypothetical protein IE077_002681 [Cardiosporidium cionae]|eukprot:KAF8820897.1 hypothetical protein IE077_002681 [Cardiosporidium cionae]